MRILKTDRGVCLGEGIGSIYYNLLTSLALVRKVIDSSRPKTKLSKKKNINFRVTSINEA